MLFRIQSLYLLGAFILSLIGSLIESKHSNNLLNLPIIILFGLSSILSLISIFQYKKRIHQFINNRLNMLILLATLGILAYRVFQLDANEDLLESLIPFSCIFLISLANKRIKKDEKLVRSLNRLR